MWHSSAPTGSELRRRTSAVRAARAEAIAAKSGGASAQMAAGVRAAARTRPALTEEEVAPRAAERAVNKAIEGVLDRIVSSVEVMSERAKASVNSWVPIDAEQAAETATTLALRQGQASPSAEQISTLCDHVNALLRESIDKAYGWNAYMCKESYDVMRFFNILVERFKGSNGHNVAAIAKDTGLPEEAVRCVAVQSYADCWRFNTMPSREGGGACDLTPMHEWAAAKSLSASRHCS